MILAVACLVPGSAYYGWKHGLADAALQWTTSRTLNATVAAGFKVKDILVTGRDHVTREELLRRLNVREGEPVFGVSVDAAQKAISEIPWVKDVTVTRRLPDTIVVDITERAPAALWQYQKKISVIDADGRTLADQDLDAFRSLPLVVGEDAPQHAAEILALVQAQPEIAAQFSSAVRVGGRRWDINLKNGLTVKLPEHDAEFALARLAKEQRDEKLLDKNILAIDLRLPDEMVVRPGPQPPEGDKDKKTI